MGKNASGNPEGVVEMDPSHRYLRYTDALGKGAYKKVYKAFDQLDAMEVAWNKLSIDKMLQSPQNLSRLYSELHFLKTLHHENILKFHTSWVDDQSRYINIITELFTSGSLRAYRKKHQQVDLKAIKNWARQILRGLVYLHNHNPPIIHRDLKCDNIFINGNSGEVKIGDLGLATMMLQAKAHSVLGTPEFMAPELYEEEYNELVDVYSFGMCLLEMATLEYPYSECQNAAQIFKRVSTGVKPAALQKVTNLQLRAFIERCLVPVSERRSAEELLEDPFLKCSNSEEVIPNDISSAVLPLKSHNSKSADKNLLDVEVECQLSSISNGAVEGIYVEPASSILQFVRVNKDIEFSLEGGTIDENSVSLYMRIIDSNGHVNNVHFTFYLDSDTSHGVASEMVEQLELGDYHVPFLSEFIDYLISCLVPNWRPVPKQLANGDNASPVGRGSAFENELTLQGVLTGENGVTIENNSLLPLALKKGDGLPNSNKEGRSDHDSSLTSLELAEANGEFKAGSGSSLTMAPLTEDGEEMKPDADSFQLSVKLTGTNACAADVDSAAAGNCNCETGESSAPPDRWHAAEAVAKKPLNGCTLQYLNDDDKEGLQSEIDDITEHYRHLFEELNRMQEVALENAHKRWMRKLGKTSG
ncbi:hypothetical protein LUZ63_012808 [Rhynchospora breviuscula]|uniref:non-specific serine/threonine protein kinase n=1 Tax=Rhynchospora breviuscula TaxID=2022672 RepID=A0A9Q0C7D8_9POAL|nr:hypothetical protein LUZ63_012808 [Rhynchospora breviuscula]